MDLRTGVSGKISAKYSFPFNRARHATFSQKTPVESRNTLRRIKDWCLNLPKRANDGCFRLFATLIVVLWFSGPIASAAPQKAGGFVARLTIDAPIGPATAEYYRDASKRAIAAGARAIVLQLNTPGGLSTSMRQIVAGILGSPVPVLGYVAPSGARAASAGTFILYACHIAAMAPATHLGAATPVSIRGSTPMPASAASLSAGTGGGAEAHKVLNDAIAYIRSLAQLRGRNMQWAEDAVRGAATLTATEAAKKHVVNFIAPNVQALLVSADGRTVMVGTHRITLHLAGLRVRDYRPNWRTQFLSIITNPTIAYGLLLVGIFGLTLEALHPGAMLPGIAGAVSLLVGAYALQLLPVNYTGLALIGLGIALMIGEVLSPTLGALGVGGVIAFVLGSIMLLHTNVPGYGVNLGVIGGIATVAAILLILILYLVVHARHRRVVTGAEELIGLSGEILEPITVAGGQGWARVHGERWRVNCACPLNAGTRVKVVCRKGLTLWVEPE